jgi:hypothetical protein
MMIVPIILLGLYLLLGTTGWFNINVSCNIYFNNDNNYYYALYFTKYLPNWTEYFFYPMILQWSYPFLQTT